MNRNPYFLAPNPPYSMSDIKLRLEIRNNRPVDLLYLTHSFISLANEYKGFLGGYGIDYNMKTRLYVREIRTGSIITDLVDLTPVAFAFLEHANTFVSFVSYAKSTYEYFTKKTREKPKEFNKDELKNFDCIIDPIAKDNGGQLNISSLRIEGDVVINNFSITTQDAQEAQNTIRKEIQNLDTPKIATYTKVVLYMYRAVNDPNRSGDKGIIESISEKPLKLIWDDAAFKEQIINADTNFFSVSFLVDCEVHTVRGGEPIAYKITKIHEIIG